MAGGWEFPGGKRERGEQRIEALRRELREEIGVEIFEAEPLIRYEHAFADRTVMLDLWFVTRYTGEPQSLEGQRLKWVTLEQLESVGLLEADWPMIEPLRKRARSTSVASFG